MLLRFATQTEIDLIKILTDDNIRDNVADMQAIVLERKNDEPIMAALTQEEAESIFGNFTVALNKGILGYVEKSVLETFNIPSNLEIRFSDFSDCIIKNRRFKYTYPKPPVVDYLRGFATEPKKVLEVEIDNDSVPNIAQREILESLPTNQNIWEQFHPLTRRTLVARGWVETNDRMTEITEAGAAALNRAQVAVLDTAPKRRGRAPNPNKVEMLVSEKQHAALVVLAASKAIDEIHFKTRNMMLNAGWINQDGSFRSAGIEMLAKLGIQMTGNTVNDDYVHVEPELSFEQTEKEMLISAKQDAALRLLASAKNLAVAMDKIHFKTKHYLVKVAGWINADGTFTSKGAEILALQNIEMTGNKIVDDYVAVEKPAKAKADVGEFFSPKQMEAFALLAANKNAVNDIHGKTKSFMMKSDWINDDGTFRTQGAAVLARLNIAMTGNVVNDEHVVVEKQKSVLLTQSQIDVFKKPSSFKDAHKKTQNVMIKNGWFTENGKITDLGKQIQASI